jgi:hypothetical protein
LRIAWPLAYHHDADLRQAAAYDGGKRLARYANIREADFIGTTAFSSHT